MSATRISSSWAAAAWAAINVVSTDEIDFPPAAVVERVAPTAEVTR